MHSVASANAPKSLSLALLALNSRPLLRVRHRLSTCFMLLLCILLSIEHQLHAEPLRPALSSCPNVERIGEATNLIEGTVLVASA